MQTNMLATIYAETATDIAALCKLINSVTLFASKQELHFFQMRVMQFPDVLWSEDEVQNCVRRINTKSKAVRHILLLLTTNEPITGEKLRILSNLVLEGNRVWSEGRFLANLLVKLDRRGIISVGNFLSETVHWHVSNSTLIAALLTWIVCAPSSVNNVKLRRWTVLRPLRVRWLAKFLLASNQAGRVDDHVLLHTFKLLTKCADRTHRQIVGDVWWIGANTSRRLAEYYVESALASADTRDCDLLVPLLAAEVTKNSMLLLTSLTKSGNSKVCKTARLALEGR